MKYAIIGCGRISQNHVESAINTGLEIIGFCDIEIEKAIALAEKYGYDETLCYSSYSYMIDDLFQKGILLPTDCSNNFFVSVATESGSHFQVVKDLILKSLRVLCEKPITLSLNQTDELIKLANCKGTILGVCQQNRFNTSSQLLKKAIDEGAFGKISNASVCIRWCREKEYYNQDSWRGKWLSDGGALMNQCIHGIDLMRWLLGGDLESLYSMLSNSLHSYIEVEDVGIAVAKFKSGILLTIEGTTNVFNDNLEETITIIGETGTVKLSGETAEKIEFWQFKDPVVDSWKDNFNNNEFNSVYGDGHIKLFKDFIEAVKNNRKPYVDAEDGRDAIENILAMYKSSFSSKRVNFPLPKNTSIEDFIDFDLKS
ncbi:MAG: Gfo/Idh/MocA family protein [Sphaerochaeta sp.]